MEPNSCFRSSSENLFPTIAQVLCGSSLDCWQLTYLIMVCPGENASQSIKNCQKNLFKSGRDEVISIFAASSGSPKTVLSEQVPHKCCLRRNNVHFPNNVHISLFSPPLFFMHVQEMSVLYLKRAGSQLVLTTALVCFRGAPSNF